MTKEKKFSFNIVHSGMILILLTVGFKGIGFIREIVFANYYGVSSTMDAFRVANIASVLVIGWLVASMNTISNPLLAEEEKKGKEKVFLKYMTMFFLVIGILNIIICFICPSVILKIIANQWYDAGKTELIKETEMFLKYFAIGNLIQWISIMYGSFLNYKHYFISSFLLENVYSVFSIMGVFISLHFGIHWLVLSIIIAYFLKFIIQFIIVQKKYHVLQEKERIKSDVVKKAVKMAFPVMLGTAATEIQLTVDTFFATGINEGIVAAINYSIMITGFAASIINTGMTRIFSVKMARAFIEKQQEKIKDLFNTQILLILIFCIPVTFVFVIFNKEIIQILYERNAFNNDATNIVAPLTAIYSFHIVFTGISSVWITAFQNQHNTKTPVFIHIMGIAINVILNIILVQFMKQYGLALATTISAIVTGVLGLILFLKKNRFISIRENMVKTIKLLCYSIISVAVMKLIYSGGLYILNTNGIYIYRTLYFGISVLIGAVVYLICLRFSKINEIKLIKLIFDIKNKGV